MIEKRIDEFGEYLFVENHSEVKLKTMIEGANFLATDTTLPRELRILEDARGAVVDFDIEVVSMLADQMHRAAKNYKYIRHAVIHDNPKNTALTMLVKRNRKDKNYFLEVFSTLEGANNWLNFG